MTATRSRDVQEGDALAGLRVLVVEDEYFLADEIRQSLTWEGAVVIGPVPNLAAALSAAAETPIDCAVLDVNLGDEMVYAVAHDLRRRGIRFIFATGYDPAIIAPEFRDAEHVEKPMSHANLVAAVHRLCRAGMGAPSGTGGGAGAVIARAACGGDAPARQRCRR